MTLLLISCLKNYPFNWKIATIILIKIPGNDKNNPDSYKPISLLNYFSEIFEKIIQSRLLD